MQLVASTKNNRSMYRSCAALMFPQTYVVRNVLSSLVVHKIASSQIALQIHVRKRLVGKHFAFADTAVSNNIEVFAIAHDCESWLFVP